MALDLQTAIPCDRCWEVMKLCPAVKVRGFPYDSYWRCPNCDLESWRTPSGMYWYAGAPVAERYLGPKVPDDREHDAQVGDDVEVRSRPARLHTALPADTV